MRVKMRLEVAILLPFCPFDTHSTSSSYQMGDENPVIVPTDIIVSYCAIQAWSCV
jgi:hypothetical protein